MSVKKALVIGGSNGIGLAISRSLINSGVHVIIAGLHEPDRNIIKESECEFFKSDLRSFDAAIFENITANNPDIDFLMICSGIGRLGKFETFSITEIEKILTINALSIIKLIKLFYAKVNNLLRCYFFDCWSCQFSVVRCVFGFKGLFMQIY